MSALPSRADIHSFHKKAVRVFFVSLHYNLRAQFETVRGAER